MEKNDSFTPQEKKSNNRQMIIISLMVMAILLIADLYVMTNMSWNIIALMFITVFFLISAYLFGNSIIKEIQDNKLRAEEQYDAITKANKASYILLKKAFEQIEEMESKSKNPTEEIITAQKAIAKVTISRNKENTDAMMNSNDKVLEKIFDFEENFGNNQSELLDKQKIMIDDSMKELMIKQQEIASSMKAMEESLKNELLQAMSSMQMVQAQTTATAQELEMPVEDFSAEETDQVLDFDLGESVMDNDTMIDTGLEEEMNLGGDLGLSEDLDLGGDLGLSEDLDLGEDLGLSEDLDLGGDLGLSEDLDLGGDLGLSEDLEMVDTLDLDVSSDLGVSEELSLEDMGISEDMDFADGLALSEEMSLGEGLDLGGDLGFSEDLDLGGGLGLSEDLGVGEDLGIGEDLGFAEDIGIDLLPEDELVADPMMEEEQAVEPEFATEEDTAMPDLSNPNKLMTPDEIAALIAKM